MGHTKTNRGRGSAARVSLGIGLIAFSLFALAPSALASGPFHTRTPALDIAGLNHACGAAVDSKGDLYLSSAGTSEVKVYDPAHTLLTSISDSHEPCGLALTTTGNLYVSEKATGEVVRYKPNAYPFSGPLTYGAREVIDASGNAKGISVDPFDNLLYVAEGTRVSVYNADGSSPAVNEVQRVFLFETTSGTFKLKFGGQETGAIPFNATAAEVKAALEALSSIGAGSVSVEKPKELEYLVTFTGALGHTDVEALSGDASGLIGGVSKAVEIAEKIKGFSGHIGEGTLTEATGVAAYTYRTTSSGNPATNRYLWVADANGLGADKLDLFGGSEVKTLKLRRELSGAATPDGSFGFGTAGAYLAADPGNREAAGDKCVAVAAQACTFGHLFLYDATHKALDEFDATGEYLDQTKNGAFADAEPTAVAIDRSGTANDGTIYVTAGSGAGAKALAFAPLKAPARATLGEPISKTQAAVTSVATDSYGYVYVLVAAKIRIYQPNGTQVLAAGNKVLIEDKKKPKLLASTVDSTGRVYVIDENGGFANDYEVTYYTPSPLGPPTSTTTYTRHEPALVTSKDFSESKAFLKAIAVNPGPGPHKDRLFVTNNNETHEYDSAANGSGLLDGEFAKALNLGNRQSIDVDGKSGNVYFAANTGAAPLISVVGPDGKEALARINESGGPTAPSGNNPHLAVDSSNGHVFEYDVISTTAREYDASGAFVAEFGNFTQGLNQDDYWIAFDNACAIHEPPLDETTTPTCKAYDPANGTLYVAVDDVNNGHPPYDVNAFGPLDYGSAPPPTEFKLTVNKTGSGSGTLTSSPAGIDCGSTCEAEFEEEEEVTLTAKASVGSELKGWGAGDCEAETVSASEGTCTLTMSEAKEASAEFESTASEQFPLEVLLGGAGTGEVSSSPAGIDCPGTCTEEFGKGVEVTLTATEGPSSQFAGWSGCDSEPGGKCLVSISEAKQVKASFDVETPLLTVVKQGPGTGILTSSPAGIDCGLTCEAQFELDEEVTLKAEASVGSELKGWGAGDCEAETVSPVEGTCTLTMSEAKEVHATFTALPRALAKQAVPIGYTETTLRGEVDPAGLVSKYHFEYLSEAEYEAAGESFAGAHKTPVGELAATKGFLAVKASITGLTEGTEYRFRLLADNAAGSDEDEGGFETLERRPAESCPNGEYRFGLSANLPDCRAYELATPAQTNGLNPGATNDGHAVGANIGFSNWLTPQRGAGAGERLSYFTLGTLPGFEGDGILDGYRAERGAGDHPAGGWKSVLFSPSFAEAAPSGGKSPVPYGLAPDQLYSLWEGQLGPGETFPQTLPRAPTCAPRRASKRSGGAAWAPTSPPTPNTSAPAARTRSSPPRLIWRTMRHPKATWRSTIAKRAAPAHTC